jgi:hypothetical protein
MEIYNFYSTGHTIIKIECRAWAKNIRYDGDIKGLGAVKFELLVN